MAELDAADRRQLRRNQFAFVDAEGVGHLPIHDESHVKNAISRWNQTDFPSKSARETARRKIVAAAGDTTSPWMTRMRWLTQRGDTPMEGPEPGQ